MEIKISTQPVQYDDALSVMESRVAEIHAGTAPGLLWLLEHPPLYTAGTSADPADLLDPQFPVHETGRGGQYTYHGPGQRVGYVILDLKKVGQGPDIKKYIWCLEEWIIRALARFDVVGERRAGRVGIWVVTPSGEAKIAAIGVRVRHWVAFHGVSINRAPDLSHFKGIVPCGISEHGVTSLKDLGFSVDAETLDRAMVECFADVFGVAFDQRGAALRCAI
jgi:lipoyl(octanoyl) transferase